MDDPQFSAFDAAVIGMAVVSLDGRFLRVNSTLCQLLGRSADELLEMDFIAVTHPADVGIDVEPARRLLAGEIERHRSRRRLVHGDGFVVWSQVTGTLLRDRAGSPVGFLTQVEDVTAAAGVSAALRSSEQRFEALVRSAADLIVIVDTDAVVQYISPAVTRMFGFDHESLVGTVGFDFVHPDDVDRVRAAFSEAVASPGSRTFVECRGLHADGSWRNGEVVISNLLADPDVAGIVLNIRDVTERTRTERELREADERFRLLVEGAEDFMIYRYRVAPEPAYEYMSRGSLRLLGYAPEDFYADPELWRRLIHPDDRELISVPPSDLSGLPRLVRWRRRDGAYAWTEHRFLAVRNEAGDLLTVEGIAHDVTERKLAEEALRASEERFRSLVQNVNDLIAVVDDDGVLCYVSPSVAPMLGHRPEEMVGLQTPDHLHPDDVPELQGAFNRARSAGGSPALAQTRARHRDGSWKWLELSIIDLRHEPSVAGLVITARDITERKRAEDQLVHQALHDALTGLPNRALFVDRLGLAISRLERRPKLAAVFFLDLDHFKVVNDSLGHPAGDQVLVAVAERLQGSLRDGDTAARLGGDEFAVLCEDLVDEGEAIQIAGRIGRAIGSQPLSVSGRELVVTASTGVAFAGHPKQRPEALLRDADAAMYRAKELGRDRFELFDEAMRARALTRLETEAALRQALEEGQLALFFQPEVELGSGRLLGAEALLRWRGEEDRLALPTEFVPVAEETGLIVPIGEWVIREACRQLARWRSAGTARTLATISVNLSARQLRHPDLTEVVAEALTESGVDPGSLRLEITESTLMSDADAAVPTLKALKALGVRLAVDDFGTGYSSLAYLKRFPVDTLKLDHSFIGGLGRNPEDGAIVRAVLSLADTLELTVVAEGVERADQVGELQALGCRVGQGNYFSPPLPPEGFSELFSG